VPTRVVDHVLRHGEGRNHEVVANSLSDKLDEMLHGPEITGLYPKVVDNQMISSLVGYL
jgi:hypothetical protein